MRRDQSQATVQWAIRVPETQAIELNALIPMSGAKTWLMSTALAKFLVLMKANDDFRAWAHQDIQKHLYNEEKRNEKDIVVRIPSELYGEFNKLFPEFGATSWFGRRVIGFFLIEMRDTVLDEILDRAVSHFAQRLESATNV